MWARHTGLRQLIHWTAGLVKRSTYRIRDIVPNCIVLNTGFGIFIEDAAEALKGKEIGGHLMLIYIVSVAYLGQCIFGHTWLCRQKQKKYVF